MDTYIMHYTPLCDRKIHMQKQCDAAGITAIYIEEHDRDLLTEQQKAKFTGLKLGLVSLILKHVEAWRLISKGTRPWGLILEDDAILCDNFLSRFNTYMTEVPDDFDILMINAGCDLHIPIVFIQPDKHIYLRGTHATVWGGGGATRCTDGYVISKSCATNLVTLFHTYPSISLELDWLMNDFLRKLNAVVFWAEPNLVRQGSQTGLFTSSYE